jgi:alginate O-acetyltransferase complex protein AlgI
MTLDHVFLLLTVLGLLVPLYWALPSRLVSVRAGLVAVVSLLVLSLLSPWLPLVPLGYFACVAGADRALSRGLSPRALKRLAWLAFVPLPFKELLVPSASTGVGADFGAATLGLAFCALRGFVALRRAAEQGRAPLVPALLSLCFFPTYLVGPIAGPERFAPEAIRARPDGREMALGLARIGIGCAMFLVVRPALTGWIGPAPPDGPGGAWPWVFARFVAVYVDFSGFSETAIGAGLLFGFRIPENFRFPLLATSMQDFWQRWHRTLAELVATYLARPLTRETGKPEMAIVASFFLVGLWHEFDANYLIWGVGHGLGLAVSLRSRRWAWLGAIPDRIGAVAGWALTLSWVTVLSAVANLPDLAAAGRLVRALTGL